MKQTIFKEKYPIFTLEIGKEETDKKSVDEIIAYFKEKIDAHPVAVYIGTFDHYAHTSSLPEHKINPQIKDVKNIIFCFGAEIPDTKVAAIRPRSIGVSDIGDAFVVDFMEAPNEKANAFMEEWAKALKKA
ncbi:MAG: hypothetical protein B6D59_00275 [Campylobacteraceae bacterium 4484_4]|nr:MAG: hypothetical protein B6D59_00275 [Campylobacteraceae bacterium 4484_4]